jgi:hypothetical protein
MRLKGASKMVENLQKTFVLFRRILGYVGEDKDKVDDAKVGRRMSVANIERPNFQGALAGIGVGRTSNSTIPKAVSLTFIPVLHRLRSYELQISLWLSVAGVYCELKSMDKALNAVEEAEKLLLILSSAHQQVRHQPSRVYREILPELGSMTSLRKDMMKEGRSKTPTNLSSSGSFWKDRDPAVTRIEADIALQVVYSLD